MIRTAALKNQVSRILVLENLAAEARFIETELKRVNFGYESRRVWTMADFQAALVDFAPDVILAAGLPPEFTAMDALHALRDRHLITPFILVTGTAMERIALDCMREGADDYVLKSNLARLPDAIRNAIAKRLAETETQLAEQVLRRSEQNYRVIIEDTLEKREAELLRALEALQESHKALQAAQHQLIQVAKMESIGRLAAGVAHEVKNPLTVIVMGVEYLRKHLPEGAHEAVQVLDDMDAAVKRATRVIHSMLDFSAPSLIHREQAQLNPIVDSALGLLDRDLAKRSITVEKRLAGNLPRMPLDTSRMEQVFLNVFQNAMEVMEHGGTLTVTTGVKRLGEVAGGEKDPGSSLGSQSVIAVEIEDTGPGIPEEFLTKIFDPFFTTKPTGQGTGLGLTVIKKIVDMHGGLIRVRNREGRGATVSLLFPMERLA